MRTRITWITSDTSSGEPRTWARIGGPYNLRCEVTHIVDGWHWYLASDILNTKVVLDWYGRPRTAKYKPAHLTLDQWKSPGPLDGFKSLKEAQWDFEKCYRGLFKLIPSFDYARMKEARADIELEPEPPI